MNTINVIIRTNYTKRDGRKPIYLQLVSNKSAVKIYSLGIAIDPNHWNIKKQRISDKSPFAQEYNLKIASFFEKANKFVFEKNYENKNVDFAEFEECVFGKNKSTLCFFEFCQIEIELRRHTVTPDYTRQCLSELSKLKKFKKNVLVDDIDYKFLQAYEYYMSNKLGNKKNTINKTFKRMKIFFNIAMRKGVIKKNPFQNYKTSTEKTTRLFLTENELSKLYTLYYSGKLAGQLQTTLRYFLFSCYTGLRYLDVYNLMYSNIFNNHILLVIHKTKDQIQIPLISKAKKLIPENLEEGDKVFKVYSNQKTNDYLKLIMLYANIDKSISFHSARHTFATISINLGIPISVIAKLLGHSDIKTTQIYAKIIDKTKDIEMLKWEKM